MFTPNEYGLFSMPTLETPRLTLRRMTMKDAKDVFEYSRDEEVACHVLWSAQRDIGEIANPAPFEDIVGKSAGQRLQRIKCRAFI